MRHLSTALQSWPIAGAFIISRGAKTHADVIHLMLVEGDHQAQAECVPYGRYGETPASVLAQIDAVRAQIEQAPNLDQARQLLQTALPAGAARNGLDCALWDLKAKQSGVPAWQAAGLHRLDPVKTAYTLSLNTPQIMGEMAAQNARRPMLKLKIGGPDDLACVEAVRQNAPKTRLIVDANEALSLDDLKRLAPDFMRLNVRLIEQPLRAGQDEDLAGFSSPVPLCADESLHTRSDLARISGLYQAVNIKLDKAGGLTEALALKAEAKALGLDIMIGCMVSTSLAMAPAVLLAQGADVVDLDGPLLLAKDRQPGLETLGSILMPPLPALWG